MQYLQDTFDGFTVLTTWQKADGGYIAYLRELPTVSAYGNEPQEAVERLADVWINVKATYDSPEKIPVAPSRKALQLGDCDGKIKELVIDPKLHYVLKLEANRDNVPLDSLINRKLKVLVDWTLAE